MVRTRMSVHGLPGQRVNSDDNANASLPRFEARKDARTYIAISNARVRQVGAQSIVADIRDLSRTGFRVEWPHGKTVGDRVWLTLPTLAPLAALVVWTSGFEIGCKFETPLHPAIFERIKALPPA